MKVSGNRWQGMTDDLTEYHPGDKTINVQGNHGLTATSGDQSISIQYYAFDCSLPLDMERRRWHPEGANKHA